MDKKNMRNSKQLPKALNQEELRQVKGGYQETIGTVGPSAGSQFVRWDEVVIRFTDDTGEVKGTTGHVLTSRSLRFGRNRR